MAGFPALQPILTHHHPRQKLPCLWATKISGIWALMVALLHILLFTWINFLIWAGPQAFIDLYDNRLYS